ncbi:MAG: hypothetical protein IJ779_03280 [Ruminococcus sp.]|nr:hypothetical protein [Ruminococcus sp.]
MIINQEIYWNIMDYIFANNHFIENPQNPKDITALEFSEEGKGVWLKNLLEAFESDKCPREAILTVFHILEIREMIRTNYAAAFKDHRIMDLTAKGYEEYMKHKGII